MIFVDSNIPMYAAGSDGDKKGPCLNFLKRILEDQVAAVSSAEVLQEILHRYRAIKRLEEGLVVYESFRSLPLRWFEILPDDVDVARDVLCQFSQISSRDALHLAVMQRHQIKKIVTYDQGFLGLPGLTVYLPETA